MANFGLIFVPNQDDRIVNNLTYPQLNYLPWDWYVRSNATDTPHCPITRASIFSTFAAVNVATPILGVLFAHKTVRAIVYRKQETSDRHWTWAFVIALLLQLAGNALIAYLYKATPEYRQGFGIQDLVLFYTTRPRISWFFLAILLPLNGGGKDSPYAAAAKGAVLAEVSLLLIGAYTMGRTAHFAATRGFYRMGALADTPYVWSARLMYSGALLFLVSLAPALASGALLLGASSRLKIYSAVFLMSFSSLLGSWLFWAGYVYLADDLWVAPPT